MFNLSNKIAIITGASRGIGSVIAHNLSKAGAKIVLISRQKSVDSINLIANDVNRCLRISHRMYNQIHSCHIHNYWY